MHHLIVLCSILCAVAAVDPIPPTPCAQRHVRALCLDADCANCVWCVPNNNATAYCTDATRTPETSCAVGDQPVIAPCAVWPVYALLLLPALVLFALLLLALCYVGWWALQRRARRTYEPLDL